MGAAILVHHSHRICRNTVIDRDYDITIFGSSSRTHIGDKVNEGTVETDTLRLCKRLEAFL